MRILVVEDEPALGNVIAKKLRLENYQVDIARDGQEAESYWMEGNYDLILLDRMLPKIDGLQVLQHMRAHGFKTLVLMITAMGEVNERVDGLDAGANDYLMKPFAFSELLARIRALLRTRGLQIENKLYCDDLEMDILRHQVTRGGKALELSAREFSFLEYLLRNQGIVLSKEKILSCVWNWDYEGDSNVVEVYMRFLRRKIDEDFDVKLLHTVRSCGYILMVKS